MFYRIGALAAVLLVAGLTEATAQYFGAPPQQNPCSAFIPIRQEVERQMLALQSANERKAPREEFCQIFQRLSASTGKMAKFMEQNQALCGVPAEAIQRAKADHGKALTFRRQACSAGPAPAGPTLSDVLSGPILPDETTIKPGRGTFDTLTGNPLAR